MRSSDQNLNIHVVQPYGTPNKKTQIKQIEKVQRNAARFVLKKPFNYQNPTSVTSMISELKWPTLEQRRPSFDLIFMYNQLVLYLQTTYQCLPLDTEWMMQYTYM